MRALATALAAARGRNVAIRLIVHRQTPANGAGRPTRGGPAEWLGGVAPAVHTTRGQEALERLAAWRR